MRVTNLYELAVNNLTVLSGTKFDIMGRFKGHVPAL